MAHKELYCNLTSNGVPIDIVGVNVTEAYKQACARCSFETDDITSVELNDTIVVDLGYTDDHIQIFNGYVDEISISRMPGIYRVECRDIIKRAINHYIVTTDLENPWQRENISAENLVRDLLSTAGITDYSGDASSFTFGTQHPAEFNLVSSWDAVQQIVSIIAWHCYALDGTVYFKELWPVPDGVPSFTFTVGDTGDILRIEYRKSTSELRNKCICFGKDGIYAEASAESPYLPSGFYKIAIVSNELIDTQEMAQGSCDYNLALYNKLTEALHVDIEGNPHVRGRQTVHVTEPFTERDGDWFCYSVQHNLSVNNATFQTSLSLTR